MPNSHKSRGEFEIRAIRYVNYRYAEVGESAIRFLSNRVQKKPSFLIPSSRKTCIFHPQDARKNRVATTPRHSSLTPQIPLSSHFFLAYFCIFRFVNRLFLILNCNDNRVAKKPKLTYATLVAQRSIDQIATFYNSLFKKYDAC